jgi:hypothetical protein
MLGPRRSRPLSMLVAGCVVAQSALAQAPVIADRIVLVRTTGHDAATARVRAELESDGWQVVDLDARGEPLETIASSRNAVAAIRVESDPPTVEVWVADPATGATASDEILTGDRGSDAVLAVRAVEALRARLLKLGIAAPQSAKPAPPAIRPERLRSPPPPPPLPAHRPWWVSAGPSVITSRGKLGPAAGATLSLSAAVHDRALVGLRLWVPGTAARLTEPEGEVNAWLGFAALGVGIELIRPDAAWSSRASLGAGGLLFHYGGEADAPYHARSSTLFTGQAVAAWDLGYRLDPRLGIRLEPSVGVTFPRPVVRVVGRTATSWGRPWLGLSFVAEFDLAPR